VGGVVLCTIVCLTAALASTRWQWYPSPPVRTTKNVFQFSSVQLLSRIRLFATPWITARQASLSITNSGSSLKLKSIESVMPSSHLILCRPLFQMSPGGEGGLQNYPAANHCCKDFRQGSKRKKNKCYISVGRIKLILICKLYLCPSRLKFK